MSDIVKFQCNIPRSVKLEIDSRVTKDKKAGDVITELLEISKTTYLLKDMPYEDLSKACAIKNFNVEQLVNEALQDYIKKVKNANKKGLSSHTKSVEADKKIAEIVNIIIEENNKAVDLKDIIYINQSSIINWLRKHEKPLLNFAVIKRYLRLHGDFLNEHHKELKITESHNRDLFMKRNFNKQD